ncbi:unnamed protein product [Moneuplotes crassus]|uniref:Uncharacterized protein n=1 Tax=Euplotes crassus TaxID=5936 RepID=A0AAD1XEB2_EUPCR|nr:unnamed protein product [Moneuplotes crassus]
MNMLTEICSIIILRWQNITCFPPFRYSIGGISNGTSQWPQEIKDTDSEIGKKPALNNNDCQGNQTLLDSLQKCNQEILPKNSNKFRHKDPSPDVEVIENFNDQGDTHSCARDGSEKAILLVEEGVKETKLPKNKSTDFFETSQKYQTEACNKEKSSSQRKRRNRKAARKNENYTNNTDIRDMFPVCRKTYIEDKNFRFNNHQSSTISSVDRTPNTLKNVCQITPAPSTIAESNKDSNCIVIESSEEIGSDVEIMTITRTEYDWDIEGYIPPKIGKNHQILSLPRCKSRTKENLLKDKMPFILCFDATKGVQQSTSSGCAQSSDPYTKFIERCRTSLKKSSSKRKPPFDEELFLRYLDSKNYNFEQAYQGIMRNRRDFRNLRDFGVRKIKNLQRNKTIEKREKEMLEQEIEEDNIIFNK